MEDKILIDRIAYLESLNDQLEAELDHVDVILKQSGFPRGLESLKDVAEELLAGDSEI